MINELGDYKSIQYEWRWRRNLVSSFQMEYELNEKAE